MLGAARNEIDERSRAVAAYVDWMATILPELSGRTREVWAARMQCKSNGQIARELGVSPSLPNRLIGLVLDRHPEAPRNPWQKNEQRQGPGRDRHPASVVGGLARRLPRERLREVLLSTYDELSPLLGGDNPLTKRCTDMAIYKSIWLSNHAPLRKLGADTGGMILNVEATIHPGHIEIVRDDDVVCVPLVHLVSATRAKTKAPKEREAA